MTETSSAIVGVISDTHGLLRPEALDALAGSDLIVHAGDVGDLAILDQLARIAPVRAVYGNTDHGELRRRLPATEVVEAGGATLYVLHILEDLDLDPSAAGFDAVVFGHTHEPSNERQDGVLFLNPGSAGPRRFSLPASVARLEIEDGRIAVTEIDLPT